MINLVGFIFVCIDLWIVFTIGHYIDLRVKDWTVAIRKGLVYVIIAVISVLFLVAQIKIVDLIIKGNQ